MPNGRIGTDLWVLGLCMGVIDGIEGRFHFRGYWSGYWVRSIVVHGNWPWRLHGAYLFKMKPCQIDSTGILQGDLISVREFQSDPTAWEEF